MIRPPGRGWWAICHNPDQAELDRTQRDAALERITTELARIDAMRSRAAKTRSTAKSKAVKVKSTDIGSAGEAAHVKAEYVLRDYRVLGRWLTQRPSGRLVIDNSSLRVA